MKGQVITWFVLLNSVRSYVPCITTDECQKKLKTPGVSVCENGQCTNPFEQGCLKAMGEKYHKKQLSRIKKEVFEKLRICNSDDDKRMSGESITASSVNIGPNCRIPEWKEYFDMNEIRIINGDWTTIIILSWIYQILLTEIFEVPTTIENGPNYTDGQGSFYYRKTDWVYAEHENHVRYANILLESGKAENEGDCRKTDLPCGHILPDTSDFDKGWDISFHSKSDYQ